MSNTPEIRFEGFTDAWEQRKLGDVGTTFTGLSGKTAEDFGHGDASFITYMNVFSNPIAKPDMVEHVEIDNKQKEVQVGDVFFTTSSETPEEVGMSCVLKEKHGITYLNSFCFGFRPTEKFDLDYLAFMLRSEPVRSQIRVLAQGISRFNISKNKMMDIDISIPSLEEQAKIGAYFYQLDNAITLHQRKSEQFKTLKKYMLQKMFPKNGESVPEIRFEGFTDAWEQRKLGEFFEKYQNTIYLKDDEEYRQVSIRNTGSVEYRATTKGANIGRKRQYVIDTIKHPNTLTFTRQTVYEGGIGFVPKELNGAIVTENMPLLDMHDADADFMVALFRTEGYYNAVIDDNTLTGSAQKALHEKQWLDSFVTVPSLEEQSKIGAYFSQLDNAITLHQRKSEQFKTLKKYMLQKMFPKY